MHAGGSGNFASLVSSPSSGTIGTLLVDAQHSLPTLGEAEDLLVYNYPKVFFLVIELACQAKFGPL